ncbi:MAG: cystathionine beta-lyase, partial [Treponema sp.]|nr:cystathionine beta-lyase [Treponema sp.]
MFNFDVNIERRGTQSLKWDTTPEGLFPMWVADTDFPAPPAVLRALRERIDHGVFGYGIPGDLPLIICTWLHDEF